MRKSIYLFFLLLPVKITKQRINNSYLSMLIETTNWLMKFWESLSNLEAQL